MIKFVIAIAGLYIFMICPKLRNRCDMSSFCKSPVAHRGIHDNVTVPENSLAAFSAALDKGYGIELDVQFTKDMKLVVFHDDDLVRLCGVEGRPIDYTLDEIMKFRLLGTDEHIPSLSEVTDLIDGRVPVIIEMKNALDGLWEMPRALYDSMKKYKGEYAIESFNPLFVRKYKKLDSSVARGILAYRFDRHLRLKKKKQKLIALTLENLLWNFLAKPDFVAYNLLDYDKIAFRLNRIFGATTVAWGMPKDEEMGKRELKAAKYFDTFICDISADMLEGEK